MWNSQDRIRSFLSFFVSSVVPTLRTGTLFWGMDSSMPPIPSCRYVASPRTVNLLWDSARLLPNHFCSERMTAPLLPALPLAFHRAAHVEQHVSSCYGFKEGGGWGCSVSCQEAGRECYPPRARRSLDLELYQLFSIIFTDISIFGSKYSHDDVCDGLKDKWQNCGHWTTKKGRQWLCRLCTTHTSGK